MEEKMAYLDWAQKRGSDAAGSAGKGAGKHLLFEMGGWAIALPGLAASGIVRKGDVGQVHEMPGMQMPLCGMVNYMGNALPIFNFAWNWGVEAKMDAMVLLGHAPKQLGFWVGGIPKSARLQDRYESMDVESMKMPEEVARMAAGLWRLKGKKDGESMPEWVVEMAGYDILADRLGLED